MRTSIALAFSVLSAAAQDMPADYAQVLKSLGKQGDYRANVLRINIPRSDLTVTVDGVATPTPFGFGGWLAMTKGSGGHDVMMGDLVLLEDEVNPVMSAILDSGLEVTALHNHFFYDNPRMFYMHVMGHGTAADLARKVKPGVDLIGKVPRAHPSPASPAATVAPGKLDTARIARIAGHQGEQSGAVYKITIGRDDLKITEMGAPINTRMGLNTWASFVGSDQSAAIAGDFAMLDGEVPRVLRALRKNGIEIVAIHNHMIGTQPAVVFLHYWGKGPAEKLAAAFRQGLDELGKK
jgi:hypothetical protein